jgi:hypothetical protein
MADIEDSERSTRIPWTVWNSQDMDFELLSGGQTSYGIGMKGRCVRATQVLSVLGRLGDGATWM